MLDEWANRDLIEVKSRNIDFLEKDFRTKGEVRKLFGLYEVVKTPEFSKQSLSAGVKLNLQTDIDDTWSPRIMIKNCRIVGAITFQVNFFLLLMYHKILYYVKEFLKKVPYCRFKIEDESFMCSPFEPLLSPSVVSRYLPGEMK